MPIIIGWICATAVLLWAAYEKGRTDQCLRDKVILDELIEHFRKENN